MQTREDSFKIKTYDCGPDGRMKVDALMRRLQEAAAAHAQELGLGLDWLKGMECYWVLSNFAIEIARLPGWNEVVNVQTWPSGYNRVVATREFVGRDADGGELFRAGSEWMVLSRKTNRPRNLAKLERPLPVDAEKAISAPLVRLEPLPNYGFAESVRVPYSALDMNGHVNNTEYVRWGLDVLRRGFGVGADVRRLHVTYLSEVFEDDQLEVAIAAAGPGGYALAGKRGQGGASVFLVEVAC